MATPLVSKGHIDEVDLIIERFNKLSKPVVFNENTSLALLIARRNQAHAAIEDRNDKATQLDASIVVMNNSDKELSKIQSAFLLQVGAVYGKNSDEYVWAGGVRQSEAIEKAKLTRQEKLKAELEQKKKE